MAVPVPLSLPSSPAELPDPSALGEAAGAGSERGCSELLLSVLEYGTVAGKSHGNNSNGSNSNSNSNGGKDHSLPPLQARTEETVRWLEAAIGPVASSSSSSLRVVEDALVDCLWLSGSTLTSLEWTSGESKSNSNAKSNAKSKSSAPSTPNKDTNPSPRAGSASKAGSPGSDPSSGALHPSVRALLDIVRSLLSSGMFSGPDGENDNDNENENENENDSETNGSSRLARRLQENWFPVLLEAVGAIRLAGPGGSTGSADDLSKRLRQHNTAANYRQQKYNLLQEESEGYSKLLGHLCGSPRATRVGASASGKKDASGDDLRALWKLVGTFELDPIRVLDLALDVLESRIRLATCSSGSARKAPPPNTNEIRWLLDVVEECPTDQLPALLRFKLANSRDGEGDEPRQTQAQARTQTPTKPGAHANAQPKGQRCLLETIALLVKQGLLDLGAFVGDFFDRESLVSDLEAAYGAFRSLEHDRVLALARVSLSGKKENPRQKELASKLEAAMEPLGRRGHKQVLSLWLVLLRWGEWDLVRPLLPPSTWTKVCCVLPETFGAALLENVEQTTLAWASRVGGACLAPELSSSTSTSNGGSSESGRTQAQKTPPAIQDTDAERDDSKDPDRLLLRFLRSVSDPLSCVTPSGCIRSRPVLFCLLCRLLRSLLAGQGARNGAAGPEEVRSSVPGELFSFLADFLVPSLSLFPSNPSLSTELWSLLELLPYDLRYRLYERWKAPGLERAGLRGGNKALPVSEAEMVAGRAARYALKRLSRDNLRDMSRNLAKVTHSSPLVVFAAILGQIESYDNMVEVVVEAQRFVNPLGLDVLGYCVLGRLSGTSGGMVNRNPLKEDGVNVSQWLQSLEAFAGEFYKARPFVEFRGILSYTIERLREGDVLKLGMLRTLLKVVGGYGFADYSPAASLNETQLDGRSGSVTLKRETMSFGIVENTNPVAASHIRSVLQADGLGVSLLVLIAQARDRIVFDSGKGAFRDVKLIGNLHDTCQVVMSILLDFLTDRDVGTETNGNKGDERILVYSKFLPSFQDLLHNYGLDMATAWLLCRPSVKAFLEVRPEELDESSSLKRFELSEKIRKSYKGTLPESVWSVLTPDMFEFFYLNVLGDIECPEGVYTSEVNRINEELERIQGLKAPVPKSETGKIDRLKAVSKQLDADMKKQKKHVGSTLKKLSDEKNNFFTSEIISREAAKVFLMYCIYPRALLSPDDAMFASAIAFRLHKIWTPGFSVMHYIDELVSIVSGALFGLTEAEAANVSILIWQTLKVANQWRFEDGMYDSEVLGKPGSYMESTVESETSTNPVSHKEFIKLYNKWQYSLADALIGCLESTEYIHMRTGLVVLSRLVKVFPTGPTLGNKLLKVLEPLQDESSSRPDIRASANAYGMMLLKARDDGKWVEENEADVKARAEKEKEAAKERKKKIEQSFQELERDNQKITEQIGTDDRRDRDRDRPRGSTRDQYSSRQTSGGGGRDDYSRTENGRDRRSDDRRGDDRRSGGRDEDWKKREREDDSNKRDDRGRGGGRRSSGGDEDIRRGGTREAGEGPRGRDNNEARWRRDRDAPPQRNNSKRGRSSTSPENDRDTDRSGPNSKRARTDDYNSNNYPSRRSGPTRSRSPPPSRSTRTSRRGNERR